MFIECKTTATDITVSWRQVGLFHNNAMSRYGLKIWEEGKLRRVPLKKNIFKGDFSFFYIQNNKKTLLLFVSNLYIKSRAQPLPIRSTGDQGKKV
jgi:hypothetical protein